MGRNRGIAFAGGFFGALSMLFAFVALFFSIALMLAPYELGELEKKINAEVPGKVVELLETAVPQLRQATMDQVRLGCLAKSMFGSAVILNQTSGYPVTEGDLDFVCATAATAQSVREVESAFVSRKVAEKAHEYYLSLKRDYVDAYANMYLPPLLFLLVFSIALSTLGFYIFSGAKIVGAMRAFSLCALIYSTITLLVVVAFWLTSPGWAERTVMENQDVNTLMGMVPAAQSQLASLFLSDAINFLAEWVNGVCVHFMLIYIALMVASGASFAFLTLAGKAMKGIEI